MYVCVKNKKCTTVKEGKQSKWLDEVNNLNATPCPAGTLNQDRVL